jgi:transposase-like protein
VCDGLKGLPAAIETVWPQAITQTCIVHLLRINRPSRPGSRRQIGRLVAA